MGKKFFPLTMVLIVTACGSDQPSPTTQFRTSAVTTNQTCRVTVSSDVARLGEVVRIVVDFPNASANGSSAWFPQAMRWIPDNTGPLHWSKDTQAVAREVFLPIAAPTSRQIFDIAYGLKDGAANAEARAFFQRPGSVVETFTLMHPELGTCEAKLRLYLESTSAYEGDYWRANQD